MWRTMRQTSPGGGRSRGRAHPGEGRVRPSPPSRVLPVGLGAEQDGVRAGLAAWLFGPGRLDADGGFSGDLPSGPGASADGAEESHAQYRRGDARRDGLARLRVRGEAARGQTLTAAQGTLDDFNDLPAGALSYDWVRIDGGIETTVATDTDT